MPDDRRSRRSGAARGDRRVAARAHAAVAATLAMLLSPLGWPSDARAQAPGAAPIRVGTVIASRQPVARSQDLVGRVTAVERVQVRARVTGFIEEVLFKEGDLVKAGAPLFRLEQPPFQAAVEQAEGELLKARGQLMNATAQRSRAEELLRSQSGSAATRDQRAAEEETAKGNELIARAELDKAKINLGYTVISSPIDGIIGRAALTKGNVVGPDSGVLATIVSRDPVYVLIPVSQRELIDVQESERRQGGRKLRVTLTLPDGSVYPEAGTVDFVDISVDRPTDTVTVRAVLPNPQGRLIDGQLVRVNISGEQAREAVVLPQPALIADQQGVYVFVVEDGKAVVRRVKLGGEKGPNAVIAEGLTGGEQVVVEGLDRLRAGAPVLASPVSPPGNRS